MTSPVSACPHLPAPLSGLGVADIQALGAERGPRFYKLMLDYAQHQWLRRFPARAILCLDRAMGADIAPGEPLLRCHPMPYAALGWILMQPNEGVFLGNPRVHFQHYADRMNQPRKELRRWRAWACWALTRRVRPELPADPRHAVREPCEAEIFHQLSQEAGSLEADHWHKIMNRQVSAFLPVVKEIQKTSQTTLDSSPPISTVCAPFLPRGGSSAG